MVYNQKTADTTKGDASPFITGTFDELLAQLQQHITTGQQALTEVGQNIDAKNKRIRDLESTLLECREYFASPDSQPDKERQLLNQIDELLVMSKSERTANGQ